MDDVTQEASIARIDLIWAFLSVDPNDGNEAVIAGPLLGPGSYVPLVAADKRRLDSLTLIAQAIARDSGRIVRLVKFASREVVREFYEADDRPNIRVNAVSLSGE